MHMLDPEARVSIEGGRADGAMRAGAGMRTNLLATLLISGCGGAPPSDVRGADADRATDVRSTFTRPMTRSNAERYVLDLVNRDRAAHGLPALAWDETAARAARRHGEDMAARGFTAHWGSDGSVPEQRYTAAGGEDVAFENVGCFVDGAESALALDAPYFPERIERFQHAFMDEVPPYDGHRRNILSPWHTALGVGVAQVEGSPIPCVVQEFVDDWGTYDELPRTLSLGDFVEIGGELRSPAVLSAVGIARIDTPVPRTARALNETRDYVVPEPYETYLPRALSSPFPRPRGILSILGNTFSLGTNLDEDAGAGLYEISVWATMPGSSEAKLVSLRTITVTAPRAP